MTHGTLEKELDEYRKKRQYEADKMHPGQIAIANFYGFMLSALVIYPLLVVLLATPDKAIALDSTTASTMSSADVIVDIEIDKKAKFVPLTRFLVEHDK